MTKRTRGRSDNFPFIAPIQKKNFEKLSFSSRSKERMAEKIPQLTEEQKLIVEKLKAQQDKVR